MLSFDTAKLVSVTVNINGSFNVVPVSDFAGETTFDYTVFDGVDINSHHGTSDTATATVSFYTVDFTRTLYSAGEDAQPIVIDAFADKEVLTPDCETATGYSIGNRVIESEKLYEALVDHTSGTFATDY